MTYKGIILQANKKSGVNMMNIDTLWNKFLDNK